MAEEPRAPGWYPDPWGAEGDTRYFDGTAWQRNERQETDTSHARRRRRSHRTGYLIAVLVVAGGIGAFAAGAFDGGTGDAAAHVRARATTTTAVPGSTELHVRPYGIGDCVTWTSGVGLVATNVVDCSQPHLLEIADSLRLDASYVDYPSDAAWDLIQTGECGPVVARYLGGPLDPSGPYGAGIIHPLRQGWDSGDRLVWCGVQSTTVAPDDPTRSGPFVGQAKGAP